MSEERRNLEVAAQEVFGPSELLLMMNNWIASKSEHRVIQLRGVYLASSKTCYGGFYYDTLKDEKRGESLTMRLSLMHREGIRDGNIVSVSGILNRSITAKGELKLLFDVTRIELLEEQHIDETELRRVELRHLKSSRGFKNIDSILEGILFKEQRPRVALLLAETSITMSDFEAGIKASKSAIDFVEHRVAFSRSKELVAKLQQLDSEEYDVLAIVRGGGSGIESLDEIDVLSAVSELSTPSIGAIGHVEDRLFIKQMLDKVAPTPNGLGQYFADLVERVSEEMSQSRAVLTEKIKKQFEKQLEDSRKQNKELQENLDKLNQTQKKNSVAMEKATEQLKEQLKESQQQNKTLKEKLSSFEEAQRKNTSAMRDIAKQQQEHSNNLQEQLKQLGDSLKFFQEKSENLQRQLTHAQSDNGRLRQELKASQNSKSKIPWPRIAVVAIAICFILAIMLANS